MDHSDLSSLLTDLRQLSIQRRRNADRRAVLDADDAEIDARYADLCRAGFAMVTAADLVTAELFHGPDATIWRLDRDGVFTEVPVVRAEWVSVGDLAAELNPEPNAWTTYGRPCASWVQPAGGAAEGVTVGETETEPAVFTEPDLPEIKRALEAFAGWRGAGTPEAEPPDLPALAGAFEERERMAMQRLEIAS